MAKDYEKALNNMTGKCINEDLSYLQIICGKEENEYATMLHIKKKKLIDTVNYARNNFGNSY